MSLFDRWKNVRRQDVDQFVEEAVAKNLASYEKRGETLRTRLLAAQQDRDRQTVPEKVEQLDQLIRVLSELLVAWEQEGIRLRRDGKI